MDGIKRTASRYIHPPSIHFGTKKAFLSSSKTFLKIAAGPPFKEKPIKKGRIADAIDWQLVICQSNAILLCGPIIGSPQLAIIIEVLACSGIKEIVFVGCAGFIKKEEKISVGDVFIPKEFILENGTGKIYNLNRRVLPKNYLQVDLTKKLTNKMPKLTYNGAIISVDSPYAQTNKMISGWAKRGIKAVDMECATLAALGETLELETASVLLISDILGDPWSSNFNKVKKTSRPIIKNIIDYLLFGKFS